MHHDVKCNTEIFNGIVDKKIKADLRRNDRNYLANDSITFHEICTSIDYRGVETVIETGRSIDAAITHVMTFEQYSNYLIGLEDHKDVVVISIDRVGVMLADGYLDLFTKD